MHEAFGENHMVHHPDFLRVRSSRGIFLLYGGDAAAVRRHPAVTKVQSVSGEEAILVFERMRWG